MSVPILRKAAACTTFLVLLGIAEYFVILHIHTQINEQIDGQVQLEVAQGRSREEKDEWTTRKERAKREEEQWITQHEKEILHRVWREKPQEKEEPWVRWVQERRLKRSRGVAPVEDTNRTSANVPYKSDIQRKFDKTSSVEKELGNPPEQQQVLSDGQPVMSEKVPQRLQEPWQRKERPLRTKLPSLSEDRLPASENAALGRNIETPKDEVNLRDDKIGFFRRPGQENLPLRRNLRDSPQSREPVELRDRPQSREPEETRDRPQSREPVESRDRPQPREPVESRDRPQPIERVETRDRITLRYNSLDIKPDIASWSSKSGKVGVRHAPLQLQGAVLASRGSPQATAELRELPAVLHHEAPEDVDSRETIPVRKRAYPPVIYQKRSEVHVADRNDWHKPYPAANPQRWSSQGKDNHQTPDQGQNKHDDNEDLLKEYMKDMWKGKITPEKTDVSDFKVIETANGPKIVQKDRPISPEILVELDDTRPYRLLSPLEEQGGNIMFTLRTTTSYHKKRLPVLMETWMTTVDAHNIFVVTDGWDQEIVDQLRKLGWLCEAGCSG